MSELEKIIRSRADPARAAVCKSFFKTAKGEYGHGDVFLGLTAPMQRKIAREHADLPLSDIAKLLTSSIHEYRFTALLILAIRYKKIGTKIEIDDVDKERKQIVDFYLKYRRGVNNWDLVDTSAPQLLGAYLYGKDTKILYRLARSKSIWDRRIAIIATQYFIRQGSFKDTLLLAEILLHDTHDLIHKAVGWMLREVGNRSREAEEAFLRKYSKKMPRTTLRYAIEKFSPEERAGYMKR